MHVQELMIKHAAWLAEQDIPKPSVAGRRWRGSTRSAGLSPASFGDLTTSLPSSPKTFATVGSPPGYSPRVPPIDSPQMGSSSSSSSPQLGPKTVVSPSSSPSLQPLPEEDEPPPFAMDGLDIATPSSGPPLDTSRRSSKTPSATSFSDQSPLMPWTRIPNEAAIPPLDLREIMAAEEEAGTQQRQRVRNVSSTLRSSAETNQPLAFARPSQRDRRRPGNPAAFNSSGASPGSASSPWRAPMPTAWRVAEAAKKSLSSIQSEQQLVGRRTSSDQQQQHPPPGSTPPSTSRIQQPSHVHDVIDRPSPSTSASQPVLSTPSTQRSEDPASAIGAPVITPTRAVHTSTPPLARGFASMSRTNKPASPWVNYSSATSSVVAATPSPSEPHPGSSSNPSAQTPPTPAFMPVVSESFSAIQRRQESEGAAILNARRGRTSLADIILSEERDRRAAEETRKEEEEFLRWWEAESERVKAAEQTLAVASGKAGRGGGSGGGGRGKGRRGGISAGGMPKNDGEDGQSHQRQGVGQEGSGLGRGVKKRRGGNVKGTPADGGTKTTSPTPQATAAAAID
jgi:inhibitor of Bruton tyrosine kinase